MNNLAVAIVTLVFCGLAYFCLHYRVLYRGIINLYEKSLQEVKQEVRARKQVEREFVNLKAVIDQWASRPVMATLTDTQVHSIIHGIGILVAPKHPNSLD